MDIIDFIIGALLMNAMAHFVLGITNTHFLGMFGYSAKGNIIYGILQFLISGLLYGINYEFSEILKNGYLIGGVTVLCLYFFFGKLLVHLFGEKNN
ncbi:MAG: NO-binding membrane sensor protein with MHYT domain [Flavobacteriales bacterium]|jgi:NO-binding membrane sensor protein with MHYT domain|tara:strand:+ start:142 stop:429 length:288 start_codon:yes stop_codon:yes gene_type:complete